MVDGRGELRRMSKAREGWMVSRMVNKDEWVLEW